MARQRMRLIRIGAQGCALIAQESPTGIRGAERGLIPLTGRPAKKRG